MPDAFFMSRKQVDFLVAGQGIAGTLLSAELLSRGYSVCVVGQSSPASASMYSSAIIQPLAGRKLQERASLRQEIDAALHCYGDLSQILQVELIQTLELLRMHQTAEEQALYESQYAAGNPFLSQPPSDSTLSLFSDSSYGAHLIAPVYQIFPDRLLQAWRLFLTKREAFVEEPFVFSELNLSENQVQYRQWDARSIVFCEGAVGRSNPFFTGTTMNKNRGEFLLLSIPGLVANRLYQGPFRLVPKGDGLWWCGSNYRWDYADLQPDIEWREQTLKRMAEWLRIPFRFVDHGVSERPTTAGQQPLLLQHPQHNTLYFFNGLGTRGFSAGPLLARQMADILTRHPGP